MLDDRLLQCRPALVIKIFIMRFSVNSSLIRKLLLLLLIVVSFQWMAATSTEYWGYCHVKITCEPQGAGKVYATASTTTGNGAATNTNNCVVPDPYYQNSFSTTYNSNGTWMLNTIPTDSRRYKFVGWKKAGATTYLSTDAYPQNGISDKATIAAVSNSDGTGDKVKKSNKTYYKPANFSTTFTLELVAVYESIINQYISVESENTALGTASIDNQENDIGDVVVITANPLSHSTKFKGWKKDGVLIEDENERMENPKTITVSELTQGTYTATFEANYEFFRIENKSTGRVINGINDNGSSTDFSSLRLVNNADKFALAGTVVEISTGHVSGGTPYYFLIQNFNSGSYYNESTGVYISMFPYLSDVSWYIQANRQAVYMADKGGTSVEASSVVENVITHWDVNGIDKDLNTKENYFSFDPTELGACQDANGWYYITLRTSWNVKFLKTGDDGQENMKAYSVTGGDANGNLELTELKGDVIPKGRPVLVACKTTSQENNRMIPTNEAANSADLALTTILKNSVKYFPNQPVPESPGSGQAYYGLGVNSAGHVGFVTQVTNTSTGMNGNRGYYLGPSPAVIPVVYPQITLAELLASGDTETVYEITDLTAVTVVDNDGLIICKDDNGATSRASKGDDEIDYMQELSGLQASDYDQSNWVGLRLPNGKELTTSNMQPNKMLTNVIGQLVNTTNPEVQLQDLPKVGDASSYTPNVYIPASFKGTQTSPVNGNTYFFVQPKPMELATIDWAQWDGEKFASVPMTEDDNGRVVNQAGLSGSFDFSAAYLVSSDNNTGFDMSEMAAGDIYQFGLALMREKTSSSAFGHVYVLGNVNGLNSGDWNPKKGVEMYTADGNIYTATLTVNASNGSNGYFSFTSKLGAWDDIASSRFGAESDPGTNFVVQQSHYGQSLNLKWWSGDTRSFEVPAGKYTLTVNLSTQKLVISPYAGGSQAPRREGADGGYIVYPLSMTKQGSVVDNVITGVSDVKAARQVMSVTYYDAMGRVSKRPFAGVNIVVTRYSDGTVSTVKRIDR